jgi:hypothetical protein
MESVMQSMAVAVIKDHSGNLSSFGGQNVVSIYRRQERMWVCARTLLFDAGSTQEAMRTNIRNFAAALGDARIVLGRSVSGIAYTVLNQMGFHICEMEQFSTECLDDLVEAIGANNDSGVAAKKPAPTDEPGQYVFDLSAALAAYPELSSKKILRPFFDSTPFHELKIFCGHLPPWLPSELTARCLGYQAHNLGSGKILLSIFPLACD